MSTQIPQSKLLCKATQTLLLANAVWTQWLSASCTRAVLAVAIVARQVQIASGAAR